MSNTHALCLMDLGHHIREDAKEAKRQANAATEETRAFQRGRLLAYNEVISLMQQQAIAFELPLTDIRLDGIDPDKDLV